MSFHIIFKNKFYIIVFIIAISLLVSLGAYLYSQNEKKLTRALTGKELQAITEFKVKQIADWHNSELYDAHVISKNSFLIKILQQFMAVGSDHNKQQLLDFLRQIKAEHDLKNIILTRPDGSILLSANDNLNSIDEILRSEVIRSVSSRSAIATDIFRCAMHDRLQINFIAPIFDQTESIIAVIVFQIDPYRILSPILKQWSTRMKTAETIMACGAHNEPVVLERIQHSNSNDPEEKLFLNHRRSVIAKALVGKHGLMDIKNYQNKDVLAYVSPVVGTSWFVIAKLEKSEMFKKLTPLVFQIILISVLLITAITLGLLYTYKKWSEQDLLERELFYRNLFEKHGVVKLLIDPETGNIIDANESAEKFYGWTRQELRQMNINNITTLNTKEIENEISKVTNYKHMYFEVKHRKSDGSVRDVEIYCSETFSKGKKILQSIVFDVTKRKEAERMVLTNEARLRSIVTILQASAETKQSFLDNALAEALKLTDSKIGYIYFYDEEKRLFTLNTWSKDVMKECSVQNPQKCYDLDKTGIWGEAIRQQKPIILNDFQSDHPFKKGYPDGHVKLLRFMTLPIFSGDRIVAAVGVANKDEEYNETDLLQLTLLMNSVWQFTEIKEAEDALRKSEAKFRRLTNEFQGLLNAIPDQITVHDKNRRVIWSNTAAAESLGKKPEDMIGKTCSELWPESGSLCHRCPVLESFVTAVPSRPQSCKLRNSLWDLRAFPLADENGSVVSVIEILRDVSEQHKLEEQLRQAQKLEGLGQLAGGIAHDFNNLLNAIIGYASLLQMRIPESEPNRHHIDQIIAAAMRGASLTRQILALSRKQLLETRPVDLNGIIKELGHMLRRLVREDIAIKYSLNTEDITIKADAGQISQVLINLATNAADAMPQGGALLIGTELFDMDEHFIQIHGYEKTGRYALLTVADTGLGMTNEMKEKIFDPFFTTKEVGKGTGLGLSVVHGIIRQHNGYINVYSEEGKGATFRIYLPVFEYETHTADEVPEQEVAGGTETILVAEDDDALRLLTSTILRQYGYRVIEAVDGTDAIEKFTNNIEDIKLVLLDGIMPKKSGRQVFEEIQKMRSEIKAVFVSGYSEDIFAQDWMPEASVRFVAKPASPDGLLRVIRILLDN